MSRGYQHDFSANSKAMFDVSGRQRKAVTMLAVLNDYFEGDLKQKTLLNVGGSAGIIDSHLADHLGRVVGIDIDKKAIAYALATYSKENLEFQVGDAMDIEFPDCSFDIVICSQVYEHVPDAQKMMDEIYRVLKFGGVCYFAAGNRLMWNEPHYNLPLLSVIPKALAHIYLRLTGKGQFYYEKHLSLWGLLRLTKNFLCVDYTKRMIKDPKLFKVEYMLKPGSLSALLARIVLTYAYWVVPGYIWLLVKK